MSRFDLGLRALDGKDFGLAIRCFDEAIRLDPALSYYRPHSTFYQTISAGRNVPPRRSLSVIPGGTYARPGAV